MRINAGSICMTLIWNVFFSWTVWEMKRRKKYETKEEKFIFLVPCVDDGSMSYAGDDS